jgi:hypothetical protein
LIQVAGIPLDSPVLIAAVISLASGIGGTYLAAVLKLRSDLKMQYDISLRQMRIEVYKDLWKLLGIFASFPERNKVTYSQLRVFSICLSTWYHKQGGLFLSKSSRRGYESIQSKVAAELAKNNDKDKLVPKEVLDGIAKEEAHKFRNSLTKDVGTRQDSKFKELD